MSEPEKDIPLRQQADLTSKFPELRSLARSRALKVLLMTLGTHVRGALQVLHLYTPPTPELLAEQAAEAQREELYRTLIEDTAAAVADGSLQEHEALGVRYALALGDLQGAVMILHRSLRIQPPGTSSLPRPDTPA